MKTAKWITLTLAAAVCAGGLFAHTSRAADYPAAQNPPRGRLLAVAQEKLGLTDDQVTQIRAQFQGERQALKDLLSKLHDARMGLRTVIRATDANEGSVRAASAKVAAVESDLAVERLKLFGKIGPILTADQRAKLSELEGRIDQWVDNVISRLDERDAQ